MFNSMTRANLETYFQGEGEGAEDYGIKASLLHEIEMVETDVEAAKMLDAIDAEWRRVRQAVAYRLAQKTEEFDTTEQLEAAAIAKRIADLVEWGCSPYEARIRAEGERAA